MRAAVGVLERIGFNGVGGNLITYLTGPLGMSTAAAAAGVNAWSGTVLVLPLVGALAADSRLGRYRAVLIAGVLYLLVSTSINLAPSSVPSTLERHPWRALIPWPLLRGRRLRGGRDSDLLQLHRRISRQVDSCLVWNLLELVSIDRATAKRPLQLPSAELMHCRLSLVHSSTALQGKMSGSTILLG